MMTEEKGRNHIVADVLLKELGNYFGLNYNYLIILWVVNLLSWLVVVILITTKVIWLTLSTCSLGRIVHFQTLVGFLQGNFACCHLLMPHWITWIFVVSGSGMSTSGRHMPSKTDAWGVRGQLGSLIQIKDEKWRTTEMNKPLKWLQGRST